jgi:predicted nucleotidyltransferase
MYLDNYIDQIRTLCEQNKVKRLFVFGSVLTDRFNESSDVDLLVDIAQPDPFDYAESYFDLKFKLQDLLKRPVDLLEEKSLKNTYLIENINQTKKLLYEA